MIGTWAKIARPLLLAICATVLVGCGTYTPDIDAGNADPNATAILINKIVDHVACELREAVQYEHNYDVDNAAIQSGHKRVLAWLDSSTAKVSLKLIAEEKGTLSPGIAFKQLLPSALTTFSNKTSVSSPQSFSTALGGSASSDATRTENVDYSFSVKTAFLGNQTKGRVKVQECKDANGMLLLADLKIKDWLTGALFPFYPNDIITAGAPDTLTHEVDFIVMLNGSVTPSWTLVNVTANTAASLAMAGRNTTGDVIISIGKSTTVGEAQNIAKLNSGFNNAVKSGPN
jgi:hypothetical protein